jgi:hypothetical protein
MPPVILQGQAVPEGRVYYFRNRGETRSYVHGLRKRSKIPTVKRMVAIEMPVYPVMIMRMERSLFQPKTQDIGGQT